MRGFAQRSHERKELGAKSHAFSGWKGPPKITKNEVHLLRFAPALPAHACVLSRASGGPCGSFSEAYIMPVPLGQCLHGFSKRGFGSVLCDTC